MKKLLFALLTLATVGLFAQTGSLPSSKVGFNAPNAVENFKTAADSAYLLQLVPPGGSFSWRDRYDKLNESPGQVSAIWGYFDANGRSFSDIFVVSDSVPLEQSMEAMEQLESDSVPLAAAAYVNEPFYPAGGYSFNWAAYEPGYLAFCQAVTQRFPGLPILLPIAPKPLSIFTKEQGGQSSHDLWNNAAFAFKASHPQFNIVGGDVHIYFTGAFVPALGVMATSDETSKTGEEKTRVTAPAERVYDYRTDTIDEGYWRNVFYQSDPTIFWEPMLNYLSSHGLLAYVTESGYIDAGELNGTFTYASNIFELVNRYGSDPRVGSLNIHGGPITSSGVGVIAPRKKWDVVDTGNPNNAKSATFDAMALYFNAAGKIYAYSPGFEITTPGTYALWFQTGTSGFVPSFSMPSNLEADYFITGVRGNRFSSVSRSMAFTKKGSTLGANEVTAFNAIEAPPLSFGYVVVAVTGRAISGCTNPDAIGYNPAATIDDGSCILRVYGCMDATALNYNPNANTPDGSCIAKVYGCTNTAATNYNPDANVDDGSCKMPPPPVVKPCRGLCRWFPSLCKCSRQ